MYEIQYELRFMNSISKSNIFVINLNSKDILRIFSSIKKYSTLAQPTYSNHRHLLFLFFKIVQNKWWKHGWKWKFLSPAWKEKEIQIKYDEHMGIYEF